MTICLEFSHRSIREYFLNTESLSSLDLLIGKFRINSSELYCSHFFSLPYSFCWYVKWERWKNTMAVYKTFRANVRACLLYNKDNVSSWSKRQHAYCPL